jgi:VanZ family protein
MNIRLERTIAWALVIVWMAVIFGFSAQSAKESKQLSTDMATQVLSSITDYFDAEDVDIKAVSLVLRKGAHLFLYFVLGFLSLNALKRSGVKQYTILIAIGICFLYGISDEIHQLLVPNRGPKVTDVFIDGFGAFLGCMFYRLLAQIAKKWVINKHKKNK